MPSSDLSSMLRNTPSALPSLTHLLLPSSVPLIIPSPTPSRDPSSVPSKHHHLYHLEYQVQGYHHIQVENLDKIPYIQADHCCVDLNHNLFLPLLYKLLHISGYLNREPVVVIPALYGIILIT